MDQDDRLPAIIEYLRMNPTDKLPGAPPGGQVIHLHEHHHYPQPPPPPPPPPPSMAEKLIPWLYFGLMATIILVICAMILAVVIVALVLGMIGVALCAAVITHLIKTTRESQINADLVRSATEKPRRRW